MNPRAFQGSQREFLLSQKPAYKDGVIGGYTTDVLAEIQHKYFKHYPIDLPHSEEQSAEWLAEVDDNAPKGQHRSINQMMASISIHEG